ncbi:hypothetical protein [Micromonospora siamensis]|uniref:Uncharacterized protein n=1 Tax=Micromonospora siamensis TaxID=299152 RepID=A0A1C5JRL1_9ACTN|nr:hypothetical protein [Micromonospora siamensis]SCG73230.1 hypothetical protein GA0074704_4879 [Micromonospora siamensis]
MPLTLAARTDPQAAYPQVLALRAALRDHDWPALRAIFDGADWAGFTAAPTTSERAVDGTVHHGTDDEAELTIGPDGVTMAFRDAISTVGYAACAALLVWPDGARRLIGDDGITLHVEPNLFTPTPDLSMVDEAVPGERHVALPARDPELIPAPPPTVGRLARITRSIREATNTAGAWLSATLLDPER